jgi:hypothetical protein
MYVVKVLFFLSPWSYDLTGTNFTCRYTEDMELDDAIHTAILTLKEG